MDQDARRISRKIVAGGSSWLNPATKMPGWRRVFGAVALAGVAAGGLGSCLIGPDDRDEASGPWCERTDPEKHPPSASGFYPYAALPSGRCTPSGRTCNIGIYGPCGSDPNYVGHPYNGYQCHCRSGQWSCEVISRGASVCSNRSPRDASPLDATEATADGRGDATSADADNSRDVALVDANGRCWDLGEESCVANRDRCHAIRGQSYASVCAGQPVSEFFGCVNGGPDGGAAVTWGWDPFTGRRARFATTQLPESWERTEPPACGSDGGVDSPADRPADS